MSRKADRARDAEIAAILREYHPHRNGSHVRSWTYCVDHTPAKPTRQPHEKKSDSDTMETFMVCSIAIVLLSLLAMVV